MAREEWVDGKVRLVRDGGEVSGPQPSPGTRLTLEEAKRRFDAWVESELGELPGWWTHMEAGGRWWPIFEGGQTPVAYEWRPIPDRWIGLPLPVVRGRDAEGRLVSEGGEVMGPAWKRPKHTLEKWLAAPKDETTHRAQMAHLGQVGRALNGPKTMQILDDVGDLPASAWLEPTPKPASSAYLDWLRERRERAAGIYRMPDYMPSVGLDHAAERDRLMILTSYGLGMTVKRPNSMLMVSACMGADGSFRRPRRPALGRCGGKARRRRWEREFLPRGRDKARATWRRVN